MLEKWWVTSDLVQIWCHYHYSIRLELKPWELRIGLADSSLKSSEGVIEVVDIDIDGFTFYIEVVVMKMKGLDRAQLILGRLFLATARPIINVDQGKLSLDQFLDNTGT